MSFVGLLCLTQKFLSTCELTVAAIRRSHCSRSRVLLLYTVSDGRISDAEALSADVVATAVAIL